MPTNKEPDIHLVGAGPKRCCSCKNDRPCNCGCVCEDMTNLDDSGNTPTTKQQENPNKDCYKAMQFNNYNYSDDPGQPTCQDPYEEPFTGPKAPCWMFVAKDCGDHVMCTEEEALTICDSPTKMTMCDGEVIPMLNCYECPCTCETLSKLAPGEAPNYFNSKASCEEALTDDDCTPFCCYKCAEVPFPQGESGSLCDDLRNNYVNCRGNSSCVGQQEGTSCWTFVNKTCADLGPDCFEEPQNQGEQCEVPASEAECGLVCYKNMDCDEITNFADEQDCEFARSAYDDEADCYRCARWSEGDPCWYLTPKTCADFGCETWYGGTSYCPLKCGDPFSEGFISGRTGYADYDPQPGDGKCVTDESGTTTCTGYETKFNWAQMEGCGLSCAGVSYESSMSTPEERPTCYLKYEEEAKYEYNSSGTTKWHDDGNPFQQDGGGGGSTSNNSTFKKTVTYASDPSEENPCRILVTTTLSGSVNNSTSQYSIGGGSMSITTTGSNSETYTSYYYGWGGGCQPSPQYCNTYACQRTSSNYSVPCTTKVTDWSGTKTSTGNCSVVTGVHPKSECGAPCNGVKNGYTDQNCESPAIKINETTSDSYDDGCGNDNIVTSTYTINVNKPITSKYAWNVHVSPTLYQVGYQVILDATTDVRNGSYPGGCTGYGPYGAISTSSSTTQNASEQATFEATLTSPADTGNCPCPCVGFSGLDHSVPLYNNSQSTTPAPFNSQYVCYGTCTSDCKITTPSGASFEFYGSEAEAPCGGRFAYPTYFQFSDWMDANTTVKCESQSAVGGIATCEMDCCPGSIS